jgi:hypothetical protein
MFQHATLLLAALAAVAPLGADASLTHGSRRGSRHNSRALHRRANNSTSGAGSSGKCKNRSHTPVSTSTAVSLSSEAPTASATPITTAASAAPTKSAAHPSTDAAEPSSSPSTSKKPSASSSAAAPSSTPSSSSGSDSGHSGAPSLKAALFPVSQTSSWTTAAQLSNAVALTDGNLKIVSRIKDISNPITTHAGRTAMQASFPAGQWGLQKDVIGGMSWYGQGQTSAEDWNNAKEITFGYGLYFTDDYAWNKGGKLPGLYFGTSESAARGCSGGNRDTSCASVRLMWREDGMGEAYTYLPNPEISSKFSANKALCNVAPKSECNDVYGASVGRGAFDFKAGAWNDVAMRVLINDDGEENGEIEVYVNGESKINVSGLIIASSDKTRAQGIMAQMFFGGSNESWKSPKDQDIFLSALSVAITKKF